MPAPPHRTSKGIQITLRSVMLMTTGACVMFGFLYWMLPSDFPVAAKTKIYSVSLAMFVIGTWMFLSARQNPWTTPVDYVTVKVDAKWKCRAQSPIVMGPVAALTGVSLTFAPMGLLWCGQVEQFGLLQWIVVPLCILTIYLVPGFYMRLAGEVMAELLKAGSEQNAAPGARDSH